MGESPWKFESSRPHHFFLNGRVARVPGHPFEKSAAAEASNLPPYLDSAYCRYPCYARKCRAVRRGRVSKPDLVASVALRRVKQHVSRLHYGIQVLCPLAYLDCPSAETKGEAGRVVQLYLGARVAQTPEN